ncbi:acyl-CoA synthetase [Polymorphum gilvum]|uniref:Acetyl-CoA synthetase (Acetate-CoA ligase) n=1 Tax=Polymorphum gilvum (strain LMG 25793 / CGMCC 1.9160 / SL003B-26A1) TaxID=991905 RepID=F2IWZ0_POLGS|nr:AMP-binding protein [Polymorphum gilvum]ADZ71567.1 Acetyl-CoA synthetase (Acetate-CoA ligase) [Polymorphum gilvum SL003B-26A1]
MTRLTEFTSYSDAQRHFSNEALWDLFDGDRNRLNIAHECIDRHADTDRVALRIAHADGRDEVITFAEISRRSAQVAHYLRRRGIEKGDRVAVMIEPSLPFYCAIFGAMKAGAVAVPMFTLFGPDGIRLRAEDCTPEVFFTNAEKAPDAIQAGTKGVTIADDAFLDSIADLPERFDWETSDDDLAVLQYTSGTTRLLPAAVRHNHRSIVTLMVAALYATGIRPGDRFFCPSSPAWGHGLWHGTLAPLALGVSTGTFSGRFDPVRLLKALQDFGITNLSAAATHYRMMRNSGRAEVFSYAIRKLSFTGEPIDSETSRYVERLFGTKVCSMYGTTEIGVILANYPGAPDFEVREGSLGKPVPGIEVEVHGPDGRPVAPGEIGELMLRRRGEWFPTKDLGRTDADGYFYHAGRADDVIISAGWTMSAVEIEDAILRHPLVAEAAAIGVPDAVRGQVVKAFVVLKGAPSGDLVAEIQELVRTNLSRHEYPRQIEFVKALPKTPAGKVNRKALRDAEAREQVGTA